MTKSGPQHRGGLVLDGELFTISRRWGPVGASTVKGIGNSWSWVKASNRVACETCGHERLHHLGFHEPGCSYLGSCSCPAFQLASEMKHAV